VNVDEILNFPSVQMLLKRLPHFQLTALSASCTERLFPCTEAFSETGFEAGVVALRSVLDRVWEQLLGDPISSGEREELEKRILEATPAEQALLAEPQALQLQLAALAAEAVAACFEGCVWRRRDRLEHPPRLALAAIEKVARSRAESGRRPTREEIELHPLTLRELRNLGDDAMVLETEPWLTLAFLERFRRSARGERGERGERSCTVDVFR